MHAVRGFTLIELSIVLVIIGLILGGVLVGRDLIETAAVRAEIAQVQQLDTAVTTFRVKYACLPGDCNNISMFLPGAINGNGNGSIDFCSSGDTGSCNSPNDEHMNVFPQLGQAKLIAGSFSNIASANAVGVNYPAAKLGQGAVGAFGWNGSGDGSTYTEWYFTTSTSYDVPESGWAAYDNFNSGSTKSNYFTSHQAAAIDSKIDDGFADTGNVQGSDSGEFGNYYRWYEDQGTYHTPNGGGCTDSTFHAYNNSNAAGGCALDIKWSNTDAAIPPWSWYSNALR
jgi:prepilin-type N-terminal cleavage/methylation domain-containing protein